MNKKLTKDTGITLIALVITIIVLLILAGVTITSLTGENGVLERAQRARNETMQAQIREQVQMEVMGSMIDLDGVYNAEAGATAINKMWGEDTASAEENVISGSHDGYNFTVSLDEDDNLNVTVTKSATP